MIAIKFLEKFCGVNEFKFCFRDYVMIEQHLPVIKPTTVHIKSKYGAEFRRFAIQPTDQSATGSVKARRLCGVTFDEFQHTLAKLHKLEFQLEADGAKFKIFYNWEVLKKFFSKFSKRHLYKKLLCFFEFAIDVEYQ